MSGQVVMDRDADRDPNYWLWHLKSDGSQFKVWAEVEMTSLPGQVSAFMIFLRPTVRMLLSSRIVQLKYSQLMPIARS